MNLFKGYLTYFLAALAIGHGIYGWISGTIPSDQALMEVWGGLTAFGIRRAITQ